LIQRVLAVLACWVSVSACAATVTAYNSYLIPPFLYNDQRAGLAPDLVDYLNLHLPVAYRLRLENVPRARLAKLVLNPQGEKFAGVALFLNPDFVGDNKQQRYLWSHPLTGDRNLLVFRAPLPWPMTGLDSLDGLHFSGIYEHQYAALDERVKAGRVSREDAADEALNLAKVETRRVDFTLLNQSNFQALLKLHRSYADTLVSLPVPWQKPFNRYILVGRDNSRLLAELNKVIAGMAGDPQWQQIVRRYGLLPPH